MGEGTNTGWFGRSIGDFGSQVGQGFDINLGWKERLQQMALANARQKLADVLGPLQVQEILQKLKQGNQVQPAGIEKLPSGAISGVTFDPRTGTYGLQNLAPGAPPEPKFPTLQAAAAYYLQKGDFEKLKQVNDEIARSRAPVAGGYTDTKTDTKGRLWGFNKDTNKYEIIPTPGASFPPPREPVDPNAAYDRFVKEQEYRAAHPTVKPSKPIPPDVLALVNGPMPKNPTPEESRRLADAADRVFGGTAYKQDLIKRGQRSTILGLRSPYGAVAYDPSEYKDIVGLLRQSISAPVDLNDYTDVVK